MQGHIFSSDRLTDDHSGGRFCEVCVYGGGERFNRLRHTEQQTPLAPGEDRGERCFRSYIYIMSVFGKTQVRIQTIKKS